MQCGLLGKAAAVSAHSLKACTPLPMLSALALWLEGAVLLCGWGNGAQKFTASPKVTGRAWRHLAARPALPHRPCFGVRTGRTRRRPLGLACALERGWPGVRALWREVHWEVATGAAPSALLGTG